MRTATSFTKWDLLYSLLDAVMMQTVLSFTLWVWLVFFHQFLKLCHQYIPPRIYGDAEKLSRYVHSQTTELMKWGRGGRGEGTVSHRRSMLTAKTSSESVNLHLHVLSAPLPFCPFFLFSQMFRVTSLNFPLCSSSSPLTPPLRVIPVPPTPIAPSTLYLSLAHSGSSSILIALILHRCLAS